MPSTKRTRATAGVKAKSERTALGTFARGSSGNPSGRPKSKSKSEFAELARGHGPECLRRLLFWVRSEESAASVRAADILISRGYGKMESSDQVPQLVLGGPDDDVQVHIRFVEPPADHARGFDDGDPRGHPNIVDFKEFAGRR